MSDSLYGVATAIFVTLFASMLLIMFIAIGQDYNQLSTLNDLKDPKAVKEYCIEKYSTASLRNLPAKCSQYFK